MASYCGPGPDLMFNSVVAVALACAMAPPVTISVAKAARAVEFKNLVIFFLL
jgi:hypothetical protein